MNIFKINIEDKTLQDKNTLSRQKITTKGKITVDMILRPKKMRGKKILSIMLQSLSVRLKRMRKNYRKNMEITCKFQNLLTIMRRIEEGIQGTEGHQK